MERYFYDLRALGREMTRAKRVRGAPKGT